MLSKLKRALGFSDNELDDNNTMYVDATVRPISSRRQDTASLREHAPEEKAQFNTAPSSPAPVSDNRQMVLKIFNQVVEVFNKSLPEFLSESVDPEAQKKYLYECLDADLKSYIADVQTAAAMQCEQKWQNEKSRLQAAMNDLEQKIKSTEAKSAEMLEKQLSAERQKRALSDRTRDLEATVAKLEAEKEQFELEAKSLINKAKVATVYEKQIAELTEDINKLRLKSLNERQGSNVYADTQAEAMSKAIEAKDAEINDKNAQIELLTSSVETLTAQNKDLQEAVDTLNMTDQMAKAMVNDMQSKASDERKNAREIQAKLDEANETIANLTQRLEKAEDTNEEIQLISQQIENFQHIKEKLEERINQLKQMLQNEKSKSQSLQETIDSLQNTIRENLQEHGRREQQLQDNISQLENKVNALNQGRDNDRGRRRQKSPDATKIGKPHDTSDIADILGDTNWLVSEPPSGSSQRMDNSGATDDFGYQEPPRRPKIPENDAQMSLF